MNRWLATIGVGVALTAGLLSGCSSQPSGDQSGSPAAHQQETQQPWMDQSKMQEMFKNQNLKPGEFPKMDDPKLKMQVPGAGTPGAPGTRPTAPTQPGK